MIIEDKWTLLYYRRVMEGLFREYLYISIYIYIYLYIYIYIYIGVFSSPMSDGSTLVLSGLEDYYLEFRIYKLGCRV